MTKESSPIDTFASWFNSTFKAKKDDEAEDKKDDAAESPDDEKDEDAMDEHGKPKKKMPMNASASKEFTTDFSIFKQADETWRWVGVTSSGFRDRDKQLVTSDALKADVLRMNKESAFGNLSFWHVMFKEENPPALDPGIALDIATCDVSEMAGTVSNLESGVFFDNAVGAAFAAQKEKFGFSREFFYPASEPDAQGNFNRIHTYRRTILPASRASNLMSAEALSIQKETKEGKMSAYKAIVGDKAYEATMARVAAKEKELEHSGIEKKEVDVTDEFVNGLRKEFASKAEVEAITKSLASISDALTTFTTGFVASQTKERDALATTLKDIGDKVQELYGDAPNSLKTQKKSVAHADDTVSADSPAVKQALALAAALKKQSTRSNSDDPFAEFANFAMPNANGN